MITSPKRKELLEIRDLMLEAMKICVRTGNLGIAKEIGKFSAIIAEKIKTHAHAPIQPTH